MRSTRARLAALLATTAAVLAIVAAPIAAADPQDLVPMCSGDETAFDDNCRQSPSQVFTHDNPGANPNTPVGVNPDEVPAV